MFRGEACRIIIGNSRAPLGLGCQMSPNRKGASSTHTRIYAAVRRIPRGRVATYGQIATLAGLPRQPRLVGYALHALPSSTTLPWHRVINARGMVSVRAGGAPSLTQRLLLEREGIHFDARGRVSLERFGWKSTTRGVRKFSRNGRKQMQAFVITAAAALMGAATLMAQQPAAPDTAWSAVEQTLGRRGAVQPGGVIRFGFPRGDLKVSIGDTQVLPGFALGGWLAFKHEGTAATMMGDLVLTEDEVAPVVDELLRAGVDVTAVHNHLLGEIPHVMYAHIRGHGPANRLAETVHAALALTKTPLGQPPAVMPVRIDLDTAGIARALGVAGRVNGGIYQVSVPRAGAIREKGETVPPALGVATAINFQPVGQGKAAITGDFVMIASEVPAVQRALRANRITITALHSHMTDESPRLLFMHFWAVDDAIALARGLRAALDHMAVKRSS